MVETYHAGSSQQGSRDKTGINSARGSSSPGYRAHDVDVRGDARRDIYDEYRRRRRADLFYEDSMILLGILLGGTAGYVAATTVFRTSWSSNSTRSPFVRGSTNRYFGQPGQAGASSSVEKDESTDLIASNKVEGTAVYNRQGEKLGEVYNFMVGKRSGKVAYAIMSFGGFLGIGEKYHPVPWDALTYDTGKKGYVVDANRERLMGAPSYQTGEEPFSQPEYRQTVRNYWSSGLT